MPSFQEMLHAALISARVIVAGQSTSQGLFGDGSQDDMSGGWAYTSTLDEFDLASDGSDPFLFQSGDDASRRGPSFTTLDDDVTQQNIRFLSIVQKAVGTGAYGWLDSALTLAVDSLLRNQSDAGGWAQSWYAGDPRSAESRMSAYADTEYRDHYTLNDNAMLDTVETLRFLYTHSATSESLCDPRLRDAIERAGDFLVAAIDGQSFPAWSAQYDRDRLDQDAVFEFASARAMEPASFNMNATGAAIETLMHVYAVTGNRTHLDAAANSAEWLRSDPITVDGYRRGGGGSLIEALLPRMFLSASDLGLTTPNDDPSAVAIFPLVVTGGYRDAAVELGLPGLRVEGDFWFYAPTQADVESGDHGQNAYERWLATLEAADPDSSIDERLDNFGYTMLGDHFVRDALRQVDFALTHSLDEYRAAFGSLRGAERDVQAFLDYTAALEDDLQDQHAVINYEFFNRETDNFLKSFVVLFGDVDFAEALVDPHEISPPDPIPAYLHLFIGTADADTLNGTPEDDVISGLAGNDWLYGNGGADTLDGGAGTDRLYGGTGADRFVFSPGMGLDVVYDFVDGVDMIALGGLTFADLTFSIYSDSDVDIRSSSGDRMVLRNIDLTQITGDDFVEITLGGPIIGTADADTLNGAPGDDVIWGLAGNDWLYGNGGADTLVGGAGTDRLYGGTGADRFVFSPGMGLDVVYDFVDGVDMIALGGLTFADLTFSIYSDSDVDIRSSSGDRMVLRNIDLSQITGDDFVEITLGGPIIGTAGADTLNGTPGDDVIWGLAGNDWLYGNGGADTLVGGAGTDRLYGGTGADKFVFSPGMGLDVVYDFEDGTDLIEVVGLEWADLTILAYGASDAEIRSTGGDRMVLRNIDPVDITEADLLFA